MLKIYDKAAWHIDGGENKDSVIKKFRLLYDLLEKHDMLSYEGKEELESGIDDSCSLHERMVNQKGASFLDAYYDDILINCNEETIVRTFEAVIK